MSDAAAATHPVHRRQSAFTLVELVASAAIMTVLMLGITSAIVLASHAVDDGDSPLGDTLATSQAVEQIASELAYAREVSEATATAITFNVADRDGDGWEETIRYAWSGTTGDPLTREYDGQGAVVFVDDIRELALTYDLRSSPRRTAGDLKESEETTLLELDSAAALTTGAELTVDTSWGECFMPTLPSGIDSWRVTRLKFKAERDLSMTSPTTIDLAVANGDLGPTGSQVDEVTVDPAEIPTSYTWITVFFGDAGGLSPDEGLCIMFTTSSGKACRLLSMTGVSVSDAIQLGRTGLDWFKVLNGHLYLYVYGTVSSATPIEVTEVPLVVRVDITVRAGRAQQSRVESGVDLLNMPEAP